MMLRTLLVASGLLLALRPASAESQPPAPGTSPRADHSEPIEAESAEIERLLEIRDKVFGESSEADRREFREALRRYSAQARRWARADAERRQRLEADSAGDSAVIDPRHEPSPDRSSERRRQMRSKVNNEASDPASQEAPNRRELPRLADGPRRGEGPPRGERIRPARRPGPPGPPGPPPPPPPPPGPPGPPPPEMGPAHQGAGGYPPPTGPRGVPAPWGPPGMPRGDRPIPWWEQFNASSEAANRDAGRERKRKLRDAAFEIEKVAHGLELVDLYEAADTLRRAAQQLRVKARSLDGPREAPYSTNAPGTFAPDERPDRAPAYSVPAPQAPTAAPPYFSAPPQPANPTPAAGWAPPPTQQAFPPGYQSTASDMAPHPGPQGNPWGGGAVYGGPTEPAPQPTR